MSGDHLLKCLICTVIFSLLLFPISVQSSWNCLGAQEYKITVEQEFEQDFKNAHPNNYKNFRIDCHITNSYATTLKSEFSATSKPNGVAEFSICGGWLFDPKYKCRVLLDDDTWTGWFWPLKPEFDCASKDNHHCSWKLHEWYLLRHSPAQNNWIREDYVLGFGES